MKLAVIPARGGSKRIPRKNLRPFCGRPIIAYSIDAAVQAGIFDRIVVSTDDPEIAEVARSLGAETPFVRPAELANDHATTVPVINHAVRWMQDHGCDVSHVCCIYATAPFIQARALVDACRVLENDDVEGYVFTATTFPFPIQRAFRVDEAGYVSMFEPANYNTRSQDLPEAYQDAGQFYWAKVAAYNAEKIFFSTDSKVYVLPRYLVQDIDTMEDWRRAELMYQVLQRSGDIA